MTEIIKAWGGFVDGEVYFDDDDGSYFEPRFALFPTRKDAKRSFDDVRPVEIHIPEKEGK